MRDRSILMITGAIVLAIVLIGTFHDQLIADSMPHWRLNNGTGDIWWGTGLMLFAFIIVGLVLSIAILLYRSLKLSISSGLPSPPTLEPSRFSLPEPGFIKP